jgi:uncharacterized protein YdeI (YjbR/CyaY-like superfamily)
MLKQDPRVDEYIASAAPFARPILRRIRRVVHAACPNVQETIKWQMPFFEREGIICGMAAFKKHCALFFWKRRQIFGATKGKAAPGHFRQITSLAELPEGKSLTGWIKQAVALNEGRVKEPVARRRKAKPAPSTPPALLAALKKNPAAAAAFKACSPSHKREYVEWIAGAKLEPTRARRVEKAVSQLARNQSLHWKYR